MKKLSLLLAVLLLIALSAAAAAPVAAQGPPEVHVARIQGVINPVVATYVQRAINDAEKAGATVLVIEMDTPGGLVTSMRDITGAILNSRVPVVVYVAPQGARAASAGVFITMAAHVAVMAPNTNIGSAHPVNLGEGEQMDETMAEKVVNDAVAQVKEMADLRGRNAEWAEKAVRESANVSSREALDLKVVDLLADDLPSLLTAIDGRQVKMADGRTLTLATDGATVTHNGMSPFEWFVHMISDPTIAYILMILGINALLYELASPGSIVPGVAGVILLLMAFYSLGTLPVNLAGVLLVVVAFVLLAAEILIPGFGAFGVGGIVALILGSLLLVQPSAPFLGVSPLAVVAVVLVTTGFFFIAIRGVVRSRQRHVTTGIEGLVDAIGEARTDLNPRGQVFVQGERWEATSEQGPISAGERIRVVAMEGMRLRVVPSHSTAAVESSKRSQKAQ